MDPEEALRLARQLARELVDETGPLSVADAAQKGYYLAETFKNIDEWLTRSGVKPKDWA